MNRYERDLFAFLVGNMKDLETELRAQSIVFEALATRIITVEGIGEALVMARNSTAMQKLIRDKYRLLENSRFGLKAFGASALLPKKPEDQGLVH